MAALIGKDGAPPLQSQGRHALLEVQLPLGVHRELGGHLRRCLLQHPGQLVVLGAHRRAALPDAAIIHPPLQKPVQLPVGLREKAFEMEAPVGKVGREVPGAGAAPVKDAGQGVGQGPPGGLVVPLPAKAAVCAASAHLACRPVENFGGVGVVLRRGGSPFKPRGHRPERLGRLLQPAGGVAPGAAVLLPGPLLPGESGKPPQQLVRHDEQQHPCRRHLVEYRQLCPAAAPAQHRRPRRKHPRQHGKHPALPGEDSRRQPGKAVHRRAHRRRRPGKVHGKPRRHPGHGPGAQPAPPARGQHRQGGQHPPNGYPGHRHPGKGHQKGPAQHQQPHRLLHADAPSRPPLLPDGEGQAVEVNRPRREEHLGGKIDRPLAAPPAGRQIHKAHQGVEGGGHRRHEPGRAGNAEFIHGHAHGKNHHGRRDVAQRLQKAQEGQIAEGGAQQGGKALRRGA